MIETIEMMTTMKVMETTIKMMGDAEPCEDAEQAERWWSREDGQDDGSVLVLEMKCPVSEQDGKIDVDWIIEGKLKKSHSYYAQVQVQMFCCDVKLCHLYVYGTQDSKNIPVGKRW